MNENLLPEAVHTAVGDAIKLSAWAGVAVLVSFLSRQRMPHATDANAVLRAGIALAPLAPSLLWARTLARWMRGLDELQRRMQYEAWFFAAMGTLFTVTALNLVQSAGMLRGEPMAQGLGWEGAFALMFFLYVLGCVIANRRYR